MLGKFKALVSVGMFAFVTSLCPAIAERDTTIYNPDLTLEVQQGQKYDIMIPEENTISQCDSTGVISYTVTSNKIGRNFLWTFDVTLGSGTIKCVLQKDE